MQFKMFTELDLVANPDNPRGLYQRVRTLRLRWHPRRGERQAFRARGQLAAADP